MAKKRKVLFVDRKNDLQSQIAEYFLENDHGNLFESYSAGPEYDIIDLDLLPCLLSEGHDLRQRFSKNFEAVKEMEYDYLVLFDELSPEEFSRVPAHKRVIRKDIGGRSSFKATDDCELFDCLKSLSEEIRAWVDDTFEDHGTADAAVE